MIATRALLDASYRGDKRGQSVPGERFRDALEQALPDLVWESYGRILSGRFRRSSDDLVPSVLEVLFEMRTALCLLNASWVTHDYYQGLVDAFGFRKLPADFSQLVRGLWTAARADEIVPLATQLVENFKQLLRDQGVHLLTLGDLAVLPVPDR